MFVVGIHGHTYVVVRMVHQLGDVDMKLGGSVATHRAVYRPKCRYMYSCTISKT
jgi:hypothetical protein